VNEIYAAKDILKAVGKGRGVRLVACPTCGRTKIDLISLAKKVEDAVKDIDKDITVAVMGCVVNGIGESGNADIGIAGGDINNVARVIEGAPLNPQISNMITQLVKETEESMGATGTAMGEGRADNTSAIIALQRAAATPTELTKQNLYETVEDLFRIYLEFMGEYYGKRMVDMDAPEEMMQQAAALGVQMPNKIQVEFDFSTLKEHPMTIKLDVGASSYYSEIASIQTLDNLLRDGHIDVIQYLERIPDGYIPARRALVSELRSRQAAMQAQQAAAPEATTGGSPMDNVGQMPVNGGSGYGALQRAINQTGDTRGLV
jgi:hypothetical protein